MVCYSWTPPDDHTRQGAIYLSQQFYELIFKNCRSERGPYLVLREIALLKYKSPTLVISGDRLALLGRELMSLEQCHESHRQIAEFRKVCTKAISDGCALTISGDMYPELWKIHADQSDAAPEREINKVRLWGCLMGVFDWFTGKQGAKQRKLYALHHGRMIRLPTDRKLILNTEGPIAIDLRISRVAGLIMHEPRENVVSVLGQPMVHALAEDKYFYTSRGMCVVFIADQIHGFHFWVTDDAAKESLVYDLVNPEVLTSISKNFAPCNASILGREGRSLQIRAGLSRDEIQTVLGTPDGITNYPDGSTSLTYFGKVPDGDYDRLHLDLSLRSGELRQAYITY
jgi:hypothetical protein